MSEQASLLVDGERPPQHSRRRATRITASLLAGVLLGALCISVLLAQHPAHGAGSDFIMADSVDHFGLHMGSRVPGIAHLFGPVTTQTHTEMHSSDFHSETHTETSNGETHVETHSSGTSNGETRMETRTETSNGTTKSSASKQSYSIGLQDNNGLKVLNVEHLSRCHGDGNDDLSVHATGFVCCSTPTSGVQCDHHDGAAWKNGWAPATDAELKALQDKNVYKDDHITGGNGQIPGSEQALIWLAESKLISQDLYKKCSDMLQERKPADDAATALRAGAPANPGGW